MLAEACLPTWFPEKMSDYKPKVSILIPTLNACSVLTSCLESIACQNYPKEQLEIIIADGGSTDGTLDVAQKYGAKIVENKLKTAEAGKMAALKTATGEFIALIDSDNILPDPNWMNNMIEPLLKEPQAVGSEPWEYTWRAQDGFITRYCALIGMNDPFVLFLGNYDRMNLLTGKWTEVAHEEEDKGNYLLVRFDKRGLPTIGANGTVFRRDFLTAIATGDYLFDIDLIAKQLKKTGSVTFIKVKNGIIHSFCENDIGKFARKQKRRVNDYFYHKFVAKDRDFEWESRDALGTGGARNTESVEGVISLFISALKNNSGMIKFMLSGVTVIPLLYQTVKGYSKKPDTAWLFHPLACEITLWEYALGTVKGLFKKSETNRKGWKQ